MSNESKTEGLISLSEFHEFLFRTIVPIRDLVDYKGEPIEKILPFWRKSELTPFLPKGKWAGISFADLIWLRILDTLRQFSYPIEKTKKVCDYFFKDAYDHDLPKKNLEYTRDLLAKKKVAGTISEEEVVVLDEIEQDLNDKELLYVLKFKVNYLTNLIIDCLNSGEEKGILIFYDGRVGEHSGQHYYSHAKRIVDPTLPHIYLSITHFLKEFIEDEQLSELVIPQLLNEEEHKVLKEMRTKNIKELHIKFKDGKVYDIESTNNGVITGEDARKIKKILGLKNYESITLNTMDEKSLSFKKTKKKK